MGKDELLRLPVGKEMQLHQYQERTVHQETIRNRPVPLAYLMNSSRVSLVVSVPSKSKQYIFFFIFLYDINKDQEGEQPGEHDKLCNAVA